MTDYEHDRMTINADFEIPDDDDDDNNEKEENHGSNSGDGETSPSGR